MPKRGQLRHEIVYGLIIILVAIIGFMTYKYIGSDESVDKTADAGTAKTAIKDNRDTILKFKDSAIVIVQAGTNSNAKEVSIQEIEYPEIDSSIRASSIYKFGPSEAEFDKPVELRIKYDSSKIEGCPSLLNFYHYDDNGNLKEIVSSKSIYCNIDFAVFDVDSFSYGYVGLAVRDEEVR